MKNLKSPQNKKILGIIILPALVALLLLAPRAKDKLMAWYQPSQQYQQYSQYNNQYYVQTQTMNVGVYDTYFSPSTMNVPAGTTVTWTNYGNMAHTATADDGSFDSGTINPGQSFSHTFMTASFVAYHCRFHGGVGGVGMSGTINVSGATQTMYPMYPTQNPTPTPYYPNQYPALQSCISTYPAYFSSNPYYNNNSTNNNNTTTNSNPNTSGDGSLSGISTNPGVTVSSGPTCQVTSTHQCLY